MCNQALAKYLRVLLLTAFNTVLFSTFFINTALAQDCNFNTLPDVCEIKPSDNPTLCDPICQVQAGCGLASDSDDDGVMDSCDACPSDPLKGLDPGICSCGESEIDTDTDGVPDCIDSCPNDPTTSNFDFCGCSHIDTDGDGTEDCMDDCPNDPLLTFAFCGCSPLPDSDGDGMSDCEDSCSTDPAKTSPGFCGCGNLETDTDGDQTPDCSDECPNDSKKVGPQVCGCGIPDIDTDLDGLPDCQDGCLGDPKKSTPGICGCGTSDRDTDEDGLSNCFDGCEKDSSKTFGGACGCGIPDIDTDQDRSVDCFDGCPSDANKIEPGSCGCGRPDEDVNRNRIPDCLLDQELKAALRRMRVAIVDLRKIKRERGCTASKICIARLRGARALVRRRLVTTKELLAKSTGAIILENNASLSNLGNGLVSSVNKTLRKVKGKPTDFEKAALKNLDQLYSMID